LIILILVNRASPSVSLEFILLENSW